MLELWCVDAMLSYLLGSLSGQPRGSYEGMATVEP